MIHNIVFCVSIGVLKWFLAGEWRCFVLMYANFNACISVVFCPHYLHIGFIFNRIVLFHAKTVLGEGVRTKGPYAQNVK